jgi:hypothetical protein
LLFEDAARAADGVVEARAAELGVAAMAGVENDDRHAFS